MKTFVLLVILLLVASALVSADDVPQTLGSSRPYFGYGPLRHAVPSDLTESVIVSAGAVTVTAKDLEAEIAKHNDSYGEQLRKYPVVALGELVADRLIAKEAKDWAKAQGKSLDETSAVQEYLTAKIPTPTVTKEEIASFYRDHEPMFGGADFESLKGVIEAYVIEEKRIEALDSFTFAAGERQNILISADWVTTQLATWSSNPVEKARASGKPSLVIFSVIGCCDKMEPVYDSIKKKHRGRLAALFVDVREEKVLSQLYDAEEIPVILAFDSSGKQVFRHNDYMLEAALIGRLKANGIDLK